MHYIGYLNTAGPQGDGRKRAADVVRRVIRGRRSVRTGYTGEGVPARVLRDIIEAGVYAPTGGNTQGVRFLPVTTRDAIMRLAEAKPGMSPKASAAIVVMERPAEGYWSRLAAQDCAAAIQNMALMATAHGLASCWFSAYADMGGTKRLRGRTWRELSGDTGELEPFGILQIGYSSCKGDASHRGRPVARQPLEHYIVGEGMDGATG